MVVVLKKFINFDKNRNIFYDNLWINEEKIVVKMPLLEDHDLKYNLKIEEFNLANNVFILAYD